MQRNELKTITDQFKPSERMPVLFLGHGSPMNAITENEFVAQFRKLGNEIPKPQAILCVSAHWETKGTHVTAMETPRTIHDFGGFPPALFAVQYPTPGSPELAVETQQLITSTTVELDQTWGLDHGAWSVVKHLYPKADVPMVELSLDKDLSPTQHYALAKELGALRDKGVLIIGSGNLVHNLRLVDWKRINDAFGFNWALEAQEIMNNAILSGDHQAMMNYAKLGSAVQLAIPTPEHFLPLLYTLALQQPGEQARLFNDTPVGGAATMTSVKIAMD
ncbi:MAG: 4,5-DOPA dioxygenase extradiol [Caldilineaceae bacterium]|jgi:4,5-DOPA dioxygenase extradiol|nr:4,5-DOPA dioxygenase extradiol [Flavobacteriales bacterium]